MAIKKNHSFMRRRSNQKWLSLSYGEVMSRSSRRVRALTVAAIVSISGVVAITLSGASPASQVPAVNAPQETDVISTAEEAGSQIIVRLKPGIVESEMVRSFSDAGVREVDEIDKLQVKVLKVPASERAAAIEELKRDPRYEYVEPDVVNRNFFVKPNDELYPQQWYMQRTLTDIAWDTVKGAEIPVAVVDTGINASHPDFAGKILAGTDIQNNDNDPADDAGHGTAVSSVITTLTNNTTGMAGTCWNCKLIPIKVNGPNGGTASDGAKGIQYAADRGAKIINASFGGAMTEVAKTAVDYAVGKGALVIAATGNTGKNEVFYPAGFPNVLAVSSTDIDDNKYSTATYGTHVDIAAPGAVIAADHDSTGFVNQSGTSYAAPMVSGVAALLWSAYPNATAAQIRAALVNTSDTCCGGMISGGRVNAARALAYMAGNGTVADKTNPSLSITSPAEGQKVNGSVSVRFSAADNTSVNKLVLRINNSTNSLNTLTNTGSFNYNTASLADGATATLHLTAYDSAGNASAAVTRKLVIDKSISLTPTVSITAPANNANVSGVLPISANATNATSVQITVNDKNAGSADTTAPYGINWNTVSAPNGTYTIKAIATNTHGSTTSAPVTVTVQNTSTTPPPPPQPPTPPTPPTTPPKTGDLNDDGKVNMADLSKLFSLWGSAGPLGDLNNNGKVEMGDMSKLFANWAP